MPNSAFETSVRHNHVGALVSVPSGPGAPFACFKRIPWTCACHRHTVVLKRFTRADARGVVAARTTLGASAMTKGASLAPLLERFFIKRLMQERRVSPHTICSYRDTFRLLMKFTQQRLRQPPSKLLFEQIDAPLVVAFLDQLEKQRGLSVRSRNLRLTAIHSFFRYAAFELPTHSAQIQRVLAIPSKRYTRTLVSFLSRPEVDAMLAAPDRKTWFGQRDHAFILMAVQTGLRLSEITGVRREDLVLGAGAHVRCIGKGRKERCTPLTKEAVDTLK